VVTNESRVLSNEDTKVLEGGEQSCTSKLAVWGGGGGIIPSAQNRPLQNDGKGHLSL
jgi:hypothetical protein